MHTEMQKAILLSENINQFIQYVYRHVHQANPIRFHPEKLYQVKLFIEEYKFQILADELWRINQFEWDGKYTKLLVESFIKGMDVIDEYVTRNTNDLFLLEARIYTLKNLSVSFSQLVFV